MLYNTSTPTYKEPLKTKQSGEKKTSFYSLRHWIQERRNKEATWSNNLIKQQKKNIDTLEGHSVEAQQPQMFGNYFLTNLHY